MEDSNTEFDFNRDLHRLPASRQQLIFRVRRLIAEGAYDTEARLEAALARMIERVESDPEHAGPDV